MGRKVTKRPGLIVFVPRKPGSFRETFVQDLKMSNENPVNTLETKSASVTKNSIGEHFLSTGYVASIEESSASESSEHETVDSVIVYKQPTAAGAVATVDAAAQVHSDDAADLPFAAQQSGGKHDHHVLNSARQEAKTFVLMQVRREPCDDGKHEKEHVYFRMDTDIHPKWMIPKIKKEPLLPEKIKILSESKLLHHHKIDPKHKIGSKRPKKLSSKNYYQAEKRAGIVSKNEEKILDKDNAKVLKKQQQVAFKEIKGEKKPTGKIEKSQSKKGKVIAIKKSIKLSPQSGKAKKDGTTKKSLKSKESNVIKASSKKSGKLLTPPSKLKSSVKSALPVKATALKGKSKINKIDERSATIVKKKAIETIKNATNKIHKQTVSNKKGLKSATQTKSANKGTSKPAKILANKSNAPSQKGKTLNNGNSLKGSQGKTATVPSGKKARTASETVKPVSTGQKSSRAAAVKPVTGVNKSAAAKPIAVVTKSRTAPTEQKASRAAAPSGVKKLQNAPATASKNSQVRQKPDTQQIGDSTENEATQKQTVVNTRRRSTKISNPIVQSEPVKRKVPAKPDLVSKLEPNEPPKPQSKRKDEATSQDNLTERKTSLRKDANKSNTNKVTANTPLVAIVKNLDEGPIKPDKPEVFTEISTDFENNVNNDVVLNITADVPQVAANTENIDISVLTRAGKDSGEQALLEMAAATTVDPAALSLEVITEERLSSTSNNVPPPECNFPDTTDPAVLLPPAQVYEPQGNENSDGATINVVKIESVCEDNNLLNQSETFNSSTHQLPQAVNSSEIEKLQLKPSSEKIECESGQDLIENVNKDIEETVSAVKSVFIAEPVLQELMESDTVKKTDITEKSYPEKNRKFSMFSIIEGALKQQLELDKSPCKPDKVTIHVEEPQRPDDQHTSDWTVNLDPDECWNCLGYMGEDTEFTLHFDFQRRDFVATCTHCNEPLKLDRKVRNKPPMPLPKARGMFSPLYARMFERLERYVVAKVTTMPPPTPPDSPKDSVSMNSSSKTSHRLYKRHDVAKNPVVMSPIPPFTHTTGYSEDFKPPALITRGTLLKT